MDNSKSIKEAVKQKYSQIASGDKSCGCCGDQSSPTINFSIMHDNYQNINGHVEDADLGLGCGIPTEFAGIQQGETVVDLGSGAGNDVFVARHYTGDSGQIIGVDFTPEMIEKARKNLTKLGYDNIEFRLGEIEKLPLEEATADLVLSNCVLNLVPDKNKAFAEIYRILKPGGRFCISDIVLRGELPRGLKKSAEMYAGCVSGALQKEEYLRIIALNNFKNIEIKKEKVITLPENIYKNYLTADEYREFQAAESGIYSITVAGSKI